MDRLKSWIKIVGGLDDLDPFIVYSKKFICAMHFTNDCSSPGTKKLNANAYPSVNLPDRRLVGNIKETVQPTGI